MFLGPESRKFNLEKCQLVSLRALVVCLSARPLSHYLFSIYCSCISQINHLKPDTLEGNHVTPATDC